MSINYKELSLSLPEEEQAKYAVGIKLIGDLADSLQRGGLLPKRFAKPIESTFSQTETPNIVETFTDQEREVLLGDGAVLYLPTGETISAQQKAKRPFWYVVDGGERLFNFPSRRIEVAIYLDPEKFFVPNSFDKTTDQQDVLMEQDAQNLRNRLGLQNIGMIRPEASEATEVIFKHTTKTRLLGKDYREQAGGYYPYMRTNTPTNKSGSDLANVGCFRADFGLYVDDWDRDVHGVDLGVARWVVPQRSR